MQRDAGQNGDKTIHIGNAEIRVDFDDREPSLDKNVNVGYDDLHCPVLTWTINVKDLYETDKYTITDDMLSQAYEFETSPSGICYLEDGQIKFNNKLNTVGDFTITYKTRVTPEQLAEHNSGYDIQNEVKLNGVKMDDATAHITPDSEPHVHKTGKPDYNYAGDRSSEETGKNYIYWTVEVDRNYGLPLARYTLNDTLSEKIQNITMLKAYGANNQEIPLTDLFADTSGTSWTFKDSVTYSEVKLVYRTEVTGDAEGITNEIKINENGNSDKPSITYDKNSQHESNKWGEYRTDEVNGVIKEYIDWTIEIKAKSGTYETINDYTVYDSEFGNSELQWISVEAKNNDQPVSIDIADVFTGTGTTRKIPSTPEMDYVKVTYRVPVGKITGRNETTGGSASNTYKVEEDKEKTVEISVPSLAGSSTVTVNKTWNNNEDTQKEKVHATFTLYYKVGTSGDWKPYNELKSDEGVITVDGTQSGEQKFTNLPAYHIDGNTRTPYYYKVEESMSVDDGVTNRYKQQMTSGEAGGAKSTTNPSYTFTNTWEGVNFTGIKQWADDEGHEADRQAVSLKLQQRQKYSDNSWLDVSGVTNPVTVNAAGNWQTTWTNLPKYDTDGVTELEYRIFEENVQSGYTMRQDNYNTITNVYNNITLTGEKFWERVDDDTDKPDSVKFKLMRTTVDNPQDSDWQDVEGSEITLNKADYANSTSKLKWSDLPKTDEGGHSYYYKIVEIQETAKQQEFDVDYWVKNGNGYYVKASEGSKTIGITNKWKKTNITVTKQWQDDRGNEHYRPNLVMVLEKSVDWGEWTEVDRIKLLNDGNGNYYPKNGDKSAASDSYTWKDLPAGDNIRYRVREVEMRELQRGTNAGQESGKKDTGYDTYYGGNYAAEPDAMNSTGNQASRNELITNRSNMITIRVDKVWEGVPAAYRADMVGYCLYRWTKSQYETLTDEQKYTDTYKFSNKYAFKTASGESDTIYWTWMLTKDPDTGEDYVYGLEEFKIANLNPESNAEEVKDRYTIDKSDDYYKPVITIGDVVNKNQTITVQNTWKKMNVSVQKDWEGGSNPEGYTSVTMKLMQKIGDDGKWEEVTGAEQKTVSSANGWKLDNAWTELPRETAQGQKIYYRAEEVKAKKSDGTEIDIANSEDFYTRPDAAGINATGTSVVTNTPKKITVNMVKHWVTTQGTQKPSAITVTLMASTNGGASWVKADSEYNVSDNPKSITVNGDNDLNASWENLPTKKMVGGVERDVIYKLVEGEVSGYAATIEPTEISKNGTVTITNTEQSPYTKKAANYVPGILVKNDNNGAYAGLNTANDGILQGNTITVEDLPKVDTAIVNINGVDTECYLFKWRIDMPLNQNASTTGYIFTDTLTDGSVFYDDYIPHGITFMRKSNPGVYGGENDQSAVDAWDKYNITSKWNTGYDCLSVTYNNDSKTSVTFDTKTPNGGKDVYYITYYTATPKSIVDAAVESKGEFVLTNRIKEENEAFPTLVDLHVTGGDEVGYIDKINNTGSGTAKSSASGSEETYAAMKNGTAHYTLDVNKDSKYLSTGNTVSVTDIFRILDYKKADGSAGTAAPELKNVGVFYYDTDGKRSRVDPSEYSYSTSVENGYYETSEDYSDKFTNANILTWDSLVLDAGNYPKGLEVIVSLSGGTSNQKWKLDPNNSPLFYSSDCKDKILVEFPGSQFEGNDTDGYGGYYDSSGNILVKLTFIDDVTSTLGAKQIQIDDENGKSVTITSRMVQSAILKTSTPCKNYVTKFTLPDGGHYEIMYDYAIKNADGTDIDAGALLTLQNEAKVSTSGGDKTDDSHKTTYCVQKSGASTRVGQNFEVVKVDIGNQSIKDLNPYFKFAKFDTELNKWIYAEDFKFKTEYSKLHEAVFNELTETDGNIPDSAKDMVLEGSYEIELEKRVLYKVIEVKAPDNHEDFQYPEVPYQKGDRTLAGNADNTYYVILNEADDVKTAGDNAKPALTDDQLTTLAASAGVSKEKIKVTTSNNPMLSVPNVRQITIGAKKTWEQDPNSAVNDVQVAVQLWRSNTKDIKDAKLVDNQKNLLADDDKTNFDDSMEAYILKKENAWTQEEIWHNLPNGNIDTEKPYYYFVKEVAYKIGNTWYKYNSTSGKFTDTNGNVWGDAAGNSAEYKPSYTDDATNSSGVIGIVNSRKLLVKKQWQDKSGNRISDPPVSSIDFNLYGITADGTEVKITLPEDRQKLTAPNWEIEVPQDLISGEGIDYKKFRIEEVTELEDYIVSDVYALNGNTGVMYLINKNTNPTSVDVNVAKTWADGNDVHGKEDAVTFTLYQFTGKQTVNQTFIENFIKSGLEYGGVTQVTGVDNPITLDGTETDPWQYAWKNLPFRGGAANDKLQYFVVETQSESTAGEYTALYSSDGNTTYKAERNLNVTNKQLGVLVVKKQWRDKDQEDHPIISNAKYSDVQVKLYRKEKAAEQIVDSDAEDILIKYGLNESNLVTGKNDVAGLAENGVITLGQSNAWTVSLKGLEENYFYYIVEQDGNGYQVNEYSPQYTNEGQLPGSDKIMTVDNFVEGTTITVKAQKTWSYIDDGSVRMPDSITLTLQQYDTINKTWSDVSSKPVTANDSWLAEWTDLPATKQYQVVEEVPNGWQPSYDGVSVDTTDDTEIRNYPITNTLDTGELKVQKKWLANETGGAAQVSVELWRQAYDGDAPYIPSTGQTQQQTQSVRSLPRNLFSMRRVQNALKETQIDEPVVQTEVVEENTVPEPKQKPRLTLNSVNAVRAMDANSSEKYKELTDISPNTVIDLNSLLSGIEVTRIETYSDGGGQIAIGCIETKIEDKGNEWGTEYTNGTNEYINEDIRLDSNSSNIKATVSDYYNTKVQDIQFYDTDSSQWISLNNSNSEPLSNGEHDCSAILEGKTISKVKVILQDGGAYNGYIKLNWTQSVTTYSDKTSTLQYDTGTTSFNNSDNPIKTFKLINQWNGSYPCNLQSVRFYYTPVVTLEITKPDEIIAGDTNIQMTATGNSGTVKWSLVDENGETTSYSFATITEDGKLSTTGSGTIYVMAQDDTTSVVSSAITITPFQITNKPAEVTVLEDSKFTPVTNATTDVTISVGEGEPAIVNGAEVTFTGNGTVTVTAKHGAAADSITFTVNSKKFAINVEPDYKYIHKGMTITLTSNPTGAEWAVKNSDDAEKVTIDGNQIKANTDNADVVLTGTRGSESSDYTLQIRPLSVNLHGSDVTPNLYTMNVNSIVPFENVVGNLNINNDGGGLIVYDEDTNTIRTGEKTGEAEISVSDAGQTLTFRLKVEVTQAEPNIPSTATKVQDITISTTNNWISSVVSGLPKTDGQGHTYRYFIKEEATGAFIPVAYSTSSEGAALQETPITLDLTNSATQSTSTTLPEAGSTGTKFYTAIGGIMLILSAAGYTTIKRRRWFEE
ncbi:MAG: Cna B-type domain-containing protein [Ruminococcus sp.]|nr:Cna B-type domain-containing protein [Ruminococcus sp.]